MNPDEFLVEIVYPDGTREPLTLRTMKAEPERISGAVRYRYFIEAEPPQGSRMNDHLPAFCGEIVDVGRASDGKSEILINIGTKEPIRISGISDIEAKAFAAQLFRRVFIQFAVREQDGP